MIKLLVFFTYLRAILHWLWIGCITIGLAIISIPMEWIGFRNGVSWINRLWAWSFLQFVGIQVIAKNQHNIPEGSFLMIFNHKSYVDILSLLQVTPRPLYFGAKKGLFSVPVFGFIMQQMGHFPIEWQRPRVVYKQYMSLDQRVKRGDIFALAPEGGRRNESGMDRFQKGPFIMATQHQLPILPVVIDGANQCMPIGSRFFNIGKWRRKVVVHHLPIISTQGLQKKDISQLRDQVYQNMAKVITNQNNKKGLM